MAEISTGNRILNAQNTFQDFITDFCVTQISDFRSQNSQIADFRFQISDFRSQNAGHTQAQISAFRKQISKKPGHIPEVGRFQISDPSAEQADVASPLQISDFRIFRPPECHPGMVCQNSRCQISESRIQIPGAKKSVRVP